MQNINKTTAVTVQGVVRLPSYGPIFKWSMVPFAVATVYTLVVLYFVKQFTALFVPYQTGGKQL